MRATSIGASGAILEAAFMVGAMGTAIDRTAGFDAVTDDLASAMRTVRRHGVNGAFEAVEGHGPTSQAHLDRLVVIVAADLACSRHVMLLLLPFRLIQGFVGPAPATTRTRVPAGPV